jgi:hypothetical protein
MKTPARNEPRLSRRYRLGGVLRATAALICLSALALGTSACGESDEDTAAGRPDTVSIELEEPDLDELAALHGERARLTRATLAAEALDPELLEETLDSAGYEGGLEDEWTGRTELFNHVVRRMLVFEGDGGSHYLGWLEAHAEDFLGSVGTRGDLDLGEDGRIYRDAGCGCHSDLPTFLAAWRDGTTVRTLLADGPGVDRKRFVALARQLG